MTQAERKKTLEEVTKIIIDSEKQARTVSVQDREALLEIARNLGRAKEGILYLLQEE